MATTALFNGEAKTANGHPYRVMVVDDDRTMRLLLEQQVADLGYEVKGAENGADALETIRREPSAVDAVLADKIMPVMDGIALVKRLKAAPETQRIPVIMLTGDDQPDEIKAGVDAGVFYYLTKPIQNPILSSVLNAALRDVAEQHALANELRKHRAGFDRVETIRFRLQTLEEATSVASLMASCFHQPDKALVGIYELLVNAIEHGNLEIGYEKKTELLQNGSWRQEIERRLARDEFMKRMVEATVTRKDEGIYVVIKDEGKGFSWQQYLRVDAARATSPNGRGIAKANHLSFDKLNFNKAGNHVVGFTATGKPLDW